jgi:hypothetical protein
MAGLDKKQHRAIDYHIRALFGAKSFEPMAIEAVRQAGLQYLSRELRLRTGRALMLTDKGLTSLRAIDQVLQASGKYIHAEPIDVSNALRGVLADLLSDALMSDNSHELVALIEARLDRKRHRHWFAVPVNGIELDSIEAVQLGDLKLIRPSTEALAALGATLSNKLDTATQLGNGPCLVGSVYGTEAYTKRKFRFSAELAIGIMSAVAAMSYESGATPFRITLEMSPEGARAAARYVFWHEEKSDITHVRGWSQHQTLRLGQQMADYLQTAPYLQHALALTQRDDLTLLEQAIVRGLFWYSDAQRDTVTVMQLIKYWSCAEVIFSGDGQAITKSVSEGVAGVLVFSGFHFKPVEEYDEIVRELIAIYAKRSKAVHDARHDHVTQRDIATLSQWTAYMLLGVLALVVESGYTAADQIKEQTQRLAGVIARSRERTIMTDGDVISPDIGKART